MFLRKYATIEDLEYCKGSIILLKIIISNSLTLNINNRHILGTFVQKIQNKNQMLEIIWKLPDRKQLLLCLHSIKDILIIAKYLCFN